LEATSLPTISGSAAEEPGGYKPSPRGKQNYSLLPDEVEADEWTAEDEEAILAFIMTWVSHYG
jgi:hypothetical protein